MKICNLASIVIQEMVQRKYESSRYYILLYAHTYINWLKVSPLMLNGANCEQKEIVAVSVGISNSL